MPRLKLKRFKTHRPAPDVIARYLHVYASEDLHHAPETLPSLDSQTLFRRDAPLVLDLGCGRGEFVVGQAAANPGVCYVGIEIHWKSVWDAINRAHAAGLENVRFVRADLRRVLAKMPPASVEEAFMLFPPPALARKRLGNDLLTDEVLDHLGRVLRDGAPFRFVTDQPEYFAQKLALLRGSGVFDEVTLSRELEGGLTRFQRFWESFEIASLRYEGRRVPRDDAAP